MDVQTSQDHQFLNSIRMQTQCVKVIIFKNFILYCKGTALRNHNHFGGDVVMDSFNNTSRDEENILDQIYMKHICSEFYYDDF